ncbi:MAG: FtsX-like permease family protein [Candidatus Hydrogenedentes bacterium]|nr:FtsX-like permease family protein [Candidatus Hydrogenedentota bacterium]
MSFAIGIAAVAVAVGSLVAVSTLLRGHETRALELSTSQSKQTAALLKKAEDDYRKITKNLGYNILILNKKEPLDQFLANGYAATTMPEDYVTRLSHSKIVTIQHLLPILHQKMKWTEQNDTPIILMGVRGEVPIAYLNPKAPLLDPVLPGTARIGHVIAAKLGIKVGDTITLLGREFKVSKVHDPKGNADDITVWIHLSEAQTLLNRSGEINAIMALSCKCPSGSVKTIRGEVTEILPDTQVVELTPQATVRDDARNRAAQLNKQVTSHQIEYHKRLTRERESFASVLVPLVTLGAMVWIGMLAYTNVRERRGEFGILRAFGLRARQIVSVFLLKAVLIGVIGAGLGYVAGFVAGSIWGVFEGVPVTGAGLVRLFDPALLAATAAGAPILAGIASWIPALMAAQQHPADILREN